MNLGLTEGYQLVQITGFSLVLDRNSGGGRACVFSKRSPTYADQTQYENKCKSCMGAATGGFSSKSHQGLEAND